MLADMESLEKREPALQKRARGNDRGDAASCRNAAYPGGTA